MRTLTSTSDELNVSSQIGINNSFQSFPIIAINTYTEGVIDTYIPILTARLESPEYKFQPFFLTDEKALEIEKAIFQERKPEYLNKKDITGKYVAQINGEIIDLDDNFDTLSKRVYSNHGYRAIFMSKVVKDKIHRTSAKIKRNI